MYEVKLCIQTRKGTQLWHTYIFRARTNTRDSARRKALRLASWRFFGCGVQISEVSYK